MKTPHSIKWYPIDVKKDEDGGLWFRLPSWIVRGFKLKEFGTNMGKVAVEIHRDMRCSNDYLYEESRANEYWKQNWKNKLRREEKIKQKEMNDNE